MLCSPDVAKLRLDLKMEVEMEEGWCAVGTAQMGVSLLPRVYSLPFLSRKTGSHSLCVCKHLVFLLLLGSDVFLVDSLPGSNISAF